MKPGNLEKSKVPNPAAKRKMRIPNVTTALRIARSAFSYVLL